MKKFISFIIFALSLSFVSAVYATGGVLQPSVPSYTQKPYQPSQGFDMSGHVSGWTNGRSKADGFGDGVGVHETYSTGESDSFLNMESVQTEFGPGTPCGVNCEDNFARIESGFAGKHESGAFSSNSGVDGAGSFANTRSGVGFDGHTSIDTGDSGHHYDDWGHDHMQD